MNNEYVSRETESALEHLRSLSQEGQLIGIAFGGVLRRRKFTSGWAGQAGQDPIFTLGAIQHLQHDLIKRTQD